MAASQVYGMVVDLSPALLRVVGSQGRYVGHCEIYMQDRVEVSRTAARSASCKQRGSLRAHLGFLQRIVI